MPDASTRWTKEVRTRLLSLRLSPTRESEIVEASRERIRVAVNGTGPNARAEVGVRRRLSSTRDTASSHGSW